MEKMFYEFRPYAFLLFGLGAIMTADQKSGLLYISCVSLILCSLAIIHGRYTYRRLRSPYKN